MWTVERNLANHSSSLCLSLSVSFLTFLSSFTSFVWNCLHEEKPKLDLTDYEKSSHSYWKHLFLLSIYHSQSHKYVDRDVLFPVALVLAD